MATACDIKEEGISEEKIILVSNPYGEQLITQYDVPFEAKDAAGNEVTANATFYIDGQQAASNILRFEQAGSYHITAQLSLEGQTIVSQPLQVQVIEPRHSTKVMVEDYTGTWCTNCPRVAYKLEEAVSQNNHIIPVAIHYSRWAGDDPFGFSDIHDLTTAYNINALPSPVINRTLNFIWDENYATLQTELNKVKPLGLALSATVSGTDLNIEAKVRFDMDLSQQDLKLVVYIIENGLHADQANATSYYGGQNPIPNFEQKHTLRAALTGVFGQSIPHNNCEANAIYTYQFNGSIPAVVSDVNNCAIVAFVIDNDTPGKMINVQEVSVGDIQDFD